MLAIERRGGSILLADSMGMRRIPKSLNISRTHFREEYGRRRSPSSERIVDDRRRCHCQYAFRKRLRLSKQRPRPVGQRESRIGPVPYRRCRQDIKDSETVDALRIIKGHAIRDATTTVMSRYREARKAKLLHDDHHVLCHGALRIWCVVRSGGRATAAPVATKIWADHRKATGKYRRDAAPHQVCLWKTVQQEDRRPGAGPARKDAGLARLDLGGFEVIHHSKIPTVRRAIQRCG